jgi:hypothetical protein
MVMVEESPGIFQDITQKTAMEDAIMKSNSDKFKQAHGTSFYQQPLFKDFSYKGISQSAAAAALARVYESNPILPLGLRYVTGTHYAR